ncbi:hypothetical protein [Marinobacter subterrani]|uniref:Uncharacterized protein n=1 Tax=Marinobacter subterrani TaxID=1658765 RepID=A0A0J7JGB8_9GAMM|nr:hypothetical protein [Marinobacter subterrani]KMQ76771.1 hypothetical protein Msub_12985 [Marinobacter subterrani]
MGMRSECQKTPGRKARKSRVFAGLAAGLIFPVFALAEDASLPDDADSVFQFEERSTIDTIPLRSIEEEALANTVIEGGLAAPAAGVPVRPRTGDDYYLDPLALQPGDSRTDLGRSEIPVEFRFSNPKSIPGQTHSNNYVIRPPQNRTYDTLNINMSER